MNDGGARQEKGVPSLIAFAIRAGVQPLELLQAAGLDPTALSDPDAFVPHQARLRLWDEAARLSGDPDFGVHLAEWVCACPEEHFDVLAYAVRSCATLGDQYRRMERYVRLIHEGSFLSLTVEGDVARLTHGLLSGATTPRQAVECMLAIAVLQGRRSTGHDFSPRDVRFTHAAPARISEQERVFRAPIRYGCPANELTLERADLGRRQRHAEPRLQAVLERQLDELLSHLPEERSFPGRVKGFLASRLMDGEPTVSAVAAKLHMSPRSLQRRLKMEGTSFASLLNDLRREMALRHLQGQKATINEVAFWLGFTEVTAFHRAFKRWTGTTPAEYQRAARHTP